MANPAQKLDLEFEQEQADKVASGSKTLDIVPVEEQDEYHRYKSLSLRAKTDESESNWLVSYADMMTLLVGFFVLLLSFSKMDPAKYEQLKKETTKIFGGEYKIPFEKLSTKLKDAVKQQGLSNQVLFQETDEGLEITFRGALFFESGDAHIKPAARTLLNTLIPAISEQAKDFGIVVEGHTDNVPITSPLFASNWELSSVRACTVLRLFEEKGFARDKLKALGWGDTRPIVSNDDPQGRPIPENQSQNRRVVIKILKNFGD